MSPQREVRKRQEGEACPDEWATDGKYNKPALEDSPGLVVQFLKDYAIYQRWCSLMEMLYLLVIDKTPIVKEHKASKLGDSGPTTYLVTCVLPVKNRLEAYEATTGKRMPLTTNPNGWTLAGQRVQCHLVKVNHTATLQFAGKGSRWSHLLQRYIEIPQGSNKKPVRGEALKLTDQTPMPSLMRDDEITEFKKLHKRIDDVVARLNRAMPRYEESDLGKETWHYDMQGRRHNRTEGGSEPYDPLNPLVSTRDVLLPPWRGQGHDGLLRNMAITFHIVDKQGNKRLIPQWKKGKQGWEQKDYVYRSGYELRTWLLQRIHAHMYDSFEVAPAYGVKIKRGATNHVHYCKRCSSRTKHRVQPTYIHCKCGFKVHRWIVLFTFHAGCEQDPIPWTRREPLKHHQTGKPILKDGKQVFINVDGPPRSVLKAWRKGRDKTWSITVPFYPDWSNTLIKRIKGVPRILEV